MTKLLWTSSSKVAVSLVTDDTSCGQVWGGGGGGGGWRGGYSGKFVVGLCRPVLQILTLFQTKKIVIFHTRF